MTPWTKNRFLIKKNGYISLNCSYLHPWCRERQTVSAQRTSMAYCIPQRIAQNAHCRRAWGSVVRMLQLTHRRTSAIESSKESNRKPPPERTAHRQWGHQTLLKRLQRRLLIGFLSSWPRFGHIWETDERICCQCNWQYVPSDLLCPESDQPTPRASGPQIWSAMSIFPNSRE